ncbi:hypothetical protein V5799_009937 [Amblyomma americanum]|uniref:PH domain-containing protein n=1 Tax=Amblyomma americanum TaxID=6943 RepID=A0AAQ4F9G4_AMBAM
MEVSRASEKEVSSWFSDLREEISLAVESTQAVDGCTKQSACVRKASKAFTSTSRIEDVLSRKLRRKRKSDQQLTRRGKCREDLTARPSLMHKTSLHFNENINIVTKLDKDL